MRTTFAAAFALLFSILPSASASAQTLSRLSLRLAELDAQRAMRSFSTHAAAVPSEDPARPVIGAQTIEVGNAGLLITGVFRGSPAHLAGLETGDMIVGVNDVPVMSLVQYDRLLRVGGAVPKLTIRNVRNGRFENRWIAVIPAGTLHSTHTRAPASVGYTPRIGFGSGLPVLPPDAGLNPYDDSPQTYLYHQGLLDR